MTKFPAPVDWVYIHPVSERRDASDRRGVAGGSPPAEGGQYGEQEPEIASSKLLHNIKGIIFDLDGTLFDNIFIAFYMIAAYPPDIFRIRNERVIRKRFAGCDYASPKDYYRAFFTALGKLCSCSPGRIRAWYFKYYMPRIVRVYKKHYESRPGVQELFRLLNSADSPRVAIYSDYPLIKQRLEALGVYPGRRTLLYDPDSFGAQKPAMRPFRQIAADLGALPEETLVIGDREDTDGLGAFHAGMRFFCLETGRRRYYRLDPNRCRPKQEPHGPSLVMYAGKWDALLKLLMKQLTVQKN